MTNLISGKEALIALANGEEVEFKCGDMSWLNLDAKQRPLEILIDKNVVFRLKPRTISINGIEVPAPFKPKVGEEYHFLSSNGYGYDGTNYSNDDLDEEYLMFGAWRTEDEIKQVVAALRQVFGLSDDAVNAARGGKYDQKYLYQ